MAKSERIRLLTPTFRVSFPDVFVKRVFQGQGEESGALCLRCPVLGFEVKDGRTIIKAAGIVVPEGSGKVEGAGRGVQQGLDRSLQEADEGT